MARRQLASMRLPSPAALSCAYVIAASFACQTQAPRERSPADDAGRRAQTGAAPGDASVDGAPTVEADAAHGAGYADAAPPVAVGDPCRGIALPPDQHFVADGMCARLVAKNLTYLRQITFAPNGDLFGVQSDGPVLLFRDADGDGFFQPNEIHEYANVGNHGINCHVDADGGWLYAGTPDGVMRWPYDPAATVAPGPGQPVITGQPSTGSHKYHTVHVYEGYLYVSSGSADNSGSPMGADYDTNRSLLRRFSLASFTTGAPFAWESGEIVTLGLRNMAGFTRNAAGRMYGVVNGMEGTLYMTTEPFRDDNPGEQLVELGPGRRYGFPFCFTAQRVVVGNDLVPPGTQLANLAAPYHDDAWCAANSMRPTTFLQAHSAPLDLVFFDTQPRGALPERWRGGAFVSLHGSTYRTIPTGYKVVWVPFDAAGNVPMPVSTKTTTTFPYETVFGGGDTSGPRDGPWTWSAEGVTERVRPVGVAISPVDGALYVSSDAGGMLYRIGSRPLR